MRTFLVLLIILLLWVWNTSAQNAAVQKAYTSQIGVREKTGHNDGTQVEAYLHSVGLGKGYPWCAAFVHWCYSRAGYNLATTGAAASLHNKQNLVYYKNKVYKEPQAGDVFTLYFPSLHRIGHTGFFDNKINSSIYATVEGNTNSAGSREGDGVYRKYRSFKATYSISRWP